MSTIQCEQLTETCTTRVYADNAFRLLGAQADESARRLRRRVEEMQHSAEMDELEEEYGQLLRPNPLPTSEGLLHAGTALQDARQRFVQEFFWFWPLEWGNSAQDPALKALANNDLNAAQKHWMSFEGRDTDKSMAAKHNLAVLGHFAALDRELRFLKDLDSVTDDAEKKADQYWNFAIKYWEQLYEEPAFWKMLRERVRELNDPRLTGTFVQEFKKSLPVAFDNINADIAAGFANAGNTSRAARHIEIMRSTNAGDDDVTGSIRRVTEPIHDRIKLAIEQARGDVQEHKSEGAKRAERLAKASGEPLRALSALLGASDPEYTEACDEVASAMLVCQVAYGNATNDWESSERLLQQALKISKGPEVRQRITENIETVKQNSELGNCWYCKKRAGEDSSCHKVKMHRVVHLSQIVSGSNHDEDVIEAAKSLSPSDHVLAAQAIAQGADPTVTRTAEIPVPRCPACKTVHEQADILFGITSIVLAAVSIWASIQIWDEWAAVFGSVVGIVISLVIGGMVAAARGSAGETTLSGEVNSFPPVKELLGRQWSIGDPPSQ